MRATLIGPALVLGMLMTDPVLADWSCEIVDVCMAGDMCRQPPEAINATIRQGTEAWALLREGMGPTVLNLLSEPAALHFIAVSAEAQGFEASAPSAAALVIAEDGTLTISEIDLGPGLAVPFVFRGRCEAASVGG